MIGRFEIKIKLKKGERWEKKGFLVENGRRINLKWEVCWRGLENIFYLIINNFSNLMNDINIFLREF